MRRFLLIITMLFMLALFGVYLAFSQGLYLPIRSKVPLQVPFRTAETSIQIGQPDGSYASTELRGVDLTASMPGNHASAFAARQADYLRWFAKIAQMGANTLRVYTIMDADFYNALHTYNTSHDKPLYLLQGIQVPDAANYGYKSAFSDEFQGQLLKDGRNAVDVIHGRRIDPARMEAYFSDVSPWVIGYLVGYEWNADTVAYTDHNTVYDGVYQGTYFSTAAEATPFEAMLTEVLDKMTAYETDKYHAQRVIGFINAPDTDFLKYQEMYARQLGKYAWIDAEHILPSDQLCSGYYAAYRMFDFCSDFSMYLSTEQVTVLGEALEKIDTSHVYSGYLDLLSAYHTMPVMLAGYGFSSARGTTEGLPLTEQQQGLRLMDVWEDAHNAGFTGVFLSMWQDQWERRSWNTAFATEPTAIGLWHDVQTDAQNYGLMAYLPGEQAVCRLDGDPSEWKNASPVLEANGASLYLRSDQEGLYLMIQGENVSADTPLYLPIEITASLGSTQSESPALSFDHAADFILCLDGEHNSRLLVQERYDAMRENFLYDQTRVNPHVSFPAADSPRFFPVCMAVANSTLVDTDTIQTVEEFRALTALGRWDTGRLTHGNGDREADGYNSLADFCFGTDCVEIRLPWLLLNVGDPVDMQVHRDYYDRYGVEFRSISTCRIGLGDGTDVISLSEVKLPALGRTTTWREHLKQSYYIVRDYWTD